MLVTGAEGFIGFHLATSLLQRGGTPVIGYDNLNPYYDPALKKARLERLQTTSQLTGSQFALIIDDLQNSSAVASVFDQYKPA